MTVVLGALQKEEPSAGVSDINTRPMHVTFFRDEYASTLRTQDITLPALGNLILKTTARTKSALPWLKVARFGNIKTGKGSLRHDGNVLAINGVELDYDGEAMPFDGAVAIVKRAGLRALLYTSPTNPRWRILLPTSQSQPPGERAKLVARANGLLGGIFSPESFTLSQSYFFGSVNSNPEHRVEITDGDFIDLRGDLDAGAIGKRGETKANGKGHAHGFAEHLALLGDGDGLNGFTAPLCSATAAYAAMHGSGLDRDVFKALLRDAISGAPKNPDRKNIENHYLTDKYLDNLIASAVRKYGGGAGLEGVAEAPAFSEENLALQFATRHAGDARFVAAWNRWLLFDGAQWKFDETRETYSLARKLCREVASTANKSRDAKTLASAKTRAAVVSLAGEDRRLAASVDQWDANPWLLNTPAGVVDLRTGKMREHRPGDYMTKMTTVAPDAACLTPLWSKFQATVTNHDAGLQAFKARMYGYGLTGSTEAHALFFLYGTGGNGKGVEIKTVTGILGNYCRTASMETFIASNVEQHPTDLAGLRGARLVTAVETEEGRRWNEAKIKAMTGGDTISARFMRQDFFDYVPQFKLAIAGNHKPSLQSVDEAIRRRFNLVPFTVTINKAERDPQLAEKLKAEWPGILQWMIDGCVQWQAQGLAAPEAVTKATDEYLAAEDVITAWLDESVVRDPNAWEATKALFASWKASAEKAGEYIGTMKRLAQNLSDRGFVPDRRHGGRGFKGIKLVPPQDMRPDPPPHNEF